ncbi:PIN domain-containing protein [Arthrobacter woluwensis]|uniref:hypothetical protein n=1 Tax=Arthrobacter woluwensis TaxID=156980 RepID=UPI0021BD85A7|nr:hypothetical protein [Arthrobacter woluwensis]
MVAWWRGFGHPDLFASALEEDDRIQVALDTNVALDILLGRNTETDGYLRSPALVDDVTYCIMGSVKTEISGLPEKDERDRAMRGIHRFQSLASDVYAAEFLTGEIVSKIHPSRLEADDSLRNDARVLAEAIVGGASVVLTNDENAARVLREIGQERGVDVLHPSQLIVALPKLQGQQREDPERIQNTNVTITNGVPGLDRELDFLVSHRSGETKADFRRLIRSCGSIAMTTLHVSDSRIVDGLIATEVTGNRLFVRIFRFRKSSFESTLLRQMLFFLRQQAVEKSACGVTISDPHPGGAADPSGILTQEGARQVRGEWQIDVVAKVLSISEVLDYEICGAKVKARLGESEVSPSALARLERDLWPLKIHDAAMENYVVPIRPGYASELLGYDQPLLARSRDLGMSRRHVYYKSPNGCPRAPGRVLWYVSGPNGGSIVAASQLLRTHVASPDVLHSRFQQYGVWTLRDIEKQARDGRAVAMQFGDTEVFARPVRLSEAEAIVNMYGKRLGTMPTTRHITSEAFQRIYTMGMKR